MILFLSLIIIFQLILISILITTFEYGKKKKEKVIMPETIKYGMTSEFINSLRDSYTDDNSLKEIVAKLLDKFGTHDYPIPVENIIRSMGFSLYSSEALKPNISAIIAVDNDLKNKFGTDKVVVSNRNDTVEHQRFAIAHEIAHFIFDCGDNMEFYDTYNTDLDYTNIPTEHRANMFAAELMMPFYDFIDFVNNKKNENKLSNNEILIESSKHFGAPKTAIARRFIELNFTELLKGTPYEGLKING